ncbi:MAG: late competence development ComFB family protein [Treponema sp.]|nr:late competence development ComFB family protein [Treponema sp.]
MLNIHNVMEEQVITRVNELYDQVKARGTPWLSCDCKNCRLDTICFVLNRLQPHYVVSGRGVTHNGEVLGDSQLAADVDKLAIEGMRLVSSAKRPYHQAGNKNAFMMPEFNQPVFNFPTFMGNILDGSSFEPLADATILLKQEGSAAEMMDVTWSNPCKTFAATKGSYTFWVKPVLAKNEEENRLFRFSLEVSAEGYTPITYAFSVPLVSECFDRRELNSTYSLKIQDLFLFHGDIENDMED